MKATLTLVAVLCAMVVTVQAQGRIMVDTMSSCPDCPAMHYDLWFRARAIEPIPIIGPKLDEAQGWGEQLAALIRLGNQFWEEVRDWQSELDWYVGTFEPHGPRTCELCGCPTRGCVASSTMADTSILRCCWPRMVTV